MEVAQPVDLVPTEMPQVQVMPEASQPYTPPTPVTAPPINNPAKEMAQKHGQPVTQETYIKQTIQPGVGHSSTMMPSMVAAPGVIGRGAKDGITYLANLFLEGNQEFQVYVDRLGPARHPVTNAILPCGQIHVLPPMPYADIYERVRQVNGGGKYSLRVLDGMGSTRHTIQFSIDMIQNPPIDMVPNGGAGVRTVGGPQNSGAFAPFAENDELLKVRSAEQVLRANKSFKMAEYDLEETDRTLRRRREAELESEERKRYAPFEQQAKIETQRAVDDLKSLIRETQHQTDRRMDQMQQNFEKAMLILSSNKPTDNSSSIMTLMATMFKGMSDSTTAMVTAVLGSKNGSNDNLETMKMISASNEKIAQMAMQSAKDATSKSDTLLQTLITNRIEHPENAVKQALDMRESGWKQAIEMFDRFESLKSDRESDDVINPEGGFWSNLGNVVLSQLQKLTAGGMKNGANMALNALAAMMGKPAGTTQYTNDELKQAAAMLIQQEAQRRGIVTPPPLAPAALPAPGQQPVSFQQPQQQPVRRFDPRKIFDRIYETETIHQQPQQQPPQQQVQAQPARQVFVPKVEEFEESAPVIDHPPVSVAPIQQQAQPLVQQPVQPSEEIDEEEEVSSLSGYVNDVIEVALEDLKSGRREHDWVDVALNKWDEEFLQALAQAPQPSEHDISVHLGMIREKADPELFRQLYSALVESPKSGEWWPKFLENFQTFLSEIKEGANATA